MSTAPFVIEKVYDAPAAKIWAAITDKEEMKQWYFDLEEFKPVVGFEFSFTGGNEDRSFTHLCKILELVPGKKLSHTWVYEGYEGSSVVTFELFEAGDKTRVKLTHEGLETFPVTAHNDFAKESFAQGWNHIIGKSLGEYLAK